MIQIVLLDVDNTLMDFDACAREAISRAFAARGLPHTDAVYPAFHEINEGMWRQIERGELTKAEHSRIRWARIFERLGLDADGPSFEPVFQQCLCETGAGAALPGALDLLRYLRGRYTLCAASNAPYRQQMSRLRNAGLLDFFDHVFISERLGCAKPSAAFFDACFAALGHPQRDEVLLVGDSLTADIAGGANYGIQTCWYNPHGAPRPESPRPTYTVAALGEIRTIL